MEVDETKETENPDKEKIIILPSFKALSDYVYDQAQKIVDDPKLAIPYKNILLPYNTKVYIEVKCYLITLSITFRKFI